MKWSDVMARLRAGGFTTALIVVLVVVAGMLPGVFQPGQTLFSNDGPLGQLMAQCHHLPERFTGCWLDLNNIGFNSGGAPPNLTFGLQWLLGPVCFSKFYAAISLSILGLGAWCFFRQSNLTPLACILGALAALLNSTFFSVACWGVSAHAITAGMIFFALAALANPASPQRWLRVILAGMAVGMAVSEGADVGAIFSLYVAGFVLYQAWTLEGARVKNLAVGTGRLLLVVVCAVFLAAQSINGLVSTSIEGVKGAQQDSDTKKARWRWATQWSLPKLEALNLVAPGLFGYRADTPNGGVYWGRVGRSTAWEDYIENGRQGQPPSGFLRFTGGGNYAGGLVVLVAIWAGAQAWRRKLSVFDLTQRKWLWFWLTVVVGSLLLSFGKFAPFYQLAYALPYVSTIRNPTKFLEPFSAGLAVLFAYGVHGLCRRYLPPAAAGADSRWVGLHEWWRRASKFEKNWVYGCALVLLAGLLGWWAYSAHRDELVTYLQSAQVNGAPEAVADFSIRMAGWFVVVFALSAGLLVLIFSGAFAGRRATRGALCLAVLLVADLGLANHPWVVYWDYVDKYASNPILDRLRDKPYEHRVATVPPTSSPLLARFTKLYKNEWLQQQFPYYNIQSFEAVEMSRKQTDFAMWMNAINETNQFGLWFHMIRAWQLTAARYVAAPVDFASFLSKQDYAAQARLLPIAQFGLEPKPGVEKVTLSSQLTAVLAENGRFALFDFTNALPRARLYSRWQVSTNDTAVLRSLFDPAFDPGGSVFVAGGVPASQAADANPEPGTVEFIHYAPKDITLKAQAAAPAVLLLNDHFHPHWKVWVDGKPAPLLRCNFLMRGVYLETGTHQVEFRFLPPTGWLYVSLAALAVAVLALAGLIFWVQKTRVMVPAGPIQAPAPAVAPVPVPAAQARKKPQRESRKGPKAKAESAGGRK